MARGSITYGFDGITIGALMDFIMVIDNPESAREFYDQYVAWLTKRKDRTQSAEAIAKSNIGWCFGEGMRRERQEMWIAVCDASHPVFGQAQVSDEEAYELGVAEGEKMLAQEKNEREFSRG